MNDEIRWIDEKTCEIDGIQFRLDTDPTIQSTPQSFVLLKHPSMLAELRKKRDEIGIKNIFELGIYRGGSVVLLDKLFKPAKLVAIEHDPPLDVLDRYIQNINASDRLIPYFGINQADAVHMKEIVRQEFPGRDIDLIIDDASHYYDETKVSFNILLPYLRPGGLFIIEDWGWAHWNDPFWQKDGGFMADQVALSNLIFEITMLTASHPEIIASINIDQYSAYIIRGPASLDDTFDVSRSYLIRDRSFIPFL